MKRFIIIIFALILCTGTNALADGKKPTFKKGESYSSVRTKMIKAGWKPFHSEDADTCSESDSRCKGRPEMESCAGTGMGNCKFLWKKDGKTTAICTVGEENAVFDKFCD